MLERWVSLLSYRGHVLMDTRHDLIVDCRVTQATGTGERDAAKEMAAGLAGAYQKTLGADKNYDTKGFVAEMRRLGVTPHVAQNTARSGGSAIDARTTRHVGYAKSINARPEDREGVWLDQGVRRAAPVQTARHRESERRVRSARDRLQPDPTGQLAQAHHGSGMNHQMPKGVRKRQQPGHKKNPNAAKSGCLSAGNDPI